MTDEKQTALGQRAAGDAVSATMMEAARFDSTTMEQARRPAPAMVAARDGFGGSLAAGLPKPPAPGGIARSTLSKAHICSRREFRAANVRYASGGSLLRTCKGHLPRPGKGGRRGSIQGFSNASRRRLLYLIARVKRDADLPLFITLTFPAVYPDAKVAKGELHTFFDRVRRAFPDVGMIWKLEPQDRGAPHFHLLAWGADVKDMRLFVPQAWYEIAGGGDWNHYLFHAGCLHPYRSCVEPVRSWKGVWFYAAKYLGKTFAVDGWNFVGRYWGVHNVGKIPLGEMMEVQVDTRVAIVMQRYQRRFAFHHKRLRLRENPTVTTFCDADQWVTRILGIPS